jgi:phage terminase large subunit-like protein
LWARPEQLAGAGDHIRNWLILGGRGAGKTRTGAEWVRAMALGHAPITSQAAGRIALIGQSHHDVRNIMIEGISGLMAIHPRVERPLWESSKRRLLWPSGAVAQAFSAEDPDSLRGPQFAAAWADELAKWPYPDAMWDMLQFGLRLGPRPRCVITTTPRPIALLKRLMNDSQTQTTTMATHANAAHLAPTFIAEIEARYAGTLLGRQELCGELIDDVEGALWSRKDIDKQRVPTPPCAMSRVVVAVDPPATSSKNSALCGLVAAGQGADGQFYVLSDASLKGTPHAWAQAAVSLYHRLEADSLVAEVNQGGEMVEAVIRAADPNLPVQSVRATRSKWLRAEPISQLYAKGRVHHVGALPDLEDEMCAFTLEGTSSNQSPDRLDALVWALTALALTPQGAGPRIRKI